MIETGKRVLAVSAIVCCAIILSALHHAPKDNWETRVQYGAMEVLLFISILVLFGMIGETPHLLRKTFNHFKKLFTK